jgi:hypothetical protein
MNSVTTETVDIPLLPPSLQSLLFLCARLSFTARAETMHDVSLLMQDLLAMSALLPFVRAFSATTEDFGEARLVLELHWLAGDELQRRRLTVAMDGLLRQLDLRAHTDDLHVLRDTFQYTDHFTGERIAGDGPVRSRIMEALQARIGVAEAEAKPYY